MSIPIINIPVEKLPSKGKLYPQGTEVSYKTLTFGEVQKLSSSKMSESEIIEFCMEGIIVKSLNKFLLTHSDYQFILMSRKLSMSKESQSKIRFLNPLTKEKEDYVFNHSDIVFKDIEVSVFTVVFNINEECSLEFTPLTVQDMLVLIKKDSYTDATAITASMIRNKHFNEAYKIISEISDYDDIEDLNKVIKLLDHSIEPFKVKCSDKKGNVQTVKLAPDRRQVHLIPFRTREDTAGSRISFGNKRDS